MLIPASLYGGFGDVQRRCKKAIKAVSGGARWTDAFGGGGMLNLDEAEGLLLLVGPSASMPGKNFHLYVPPRVTQDAFFDETLAQENEDAVFADCLTTAWGTLTLLSRNHTFIWPLARYVNPPARERPLLEACVRYWPVFEAIGSRFWAGSLPPKRLAEHITAVQGALVKLGMPEDRVFGRPVDDLVALAAEVGVTPKVNEP